MHHCSYNWNFCNDFLFGFFGFKAAQIVQINMVQPVGQWSSLEYPLHNLCVHFVGANGIKLMTMWQNMAWQQEIG